MLLLFNSSYNKVLELHVKYDYKLYEPSTKEKKRKQKTKIEE